jgi:protein TonB
MTQPVGVRAASFLTSAALLGILVIGAFSVTITMQHLPLVSPPPVDALVERPPEPPKPPPPRPHEPPPPTPISNTGPIDLPTVALDPTGPPTQTTLPVSNPGPAMITNPRWLRQPSNLAQYYPPRALARDITGSVLLDCLVDTNGALNCNVMSETPTGWGFGEAARRIARDYRMVPATRDGQAIEGRYRMRVPFQVE